MSFKYSHFGDQEVEIALKGSQHTIDFTGKITPINEDTLLIIEEEKEYLLNTKHILYIVLHEEDEEEYEDED